LPVPCSPSTLHLTHSMAASKIATKLGRSLLPTESLGTHRIVIDGNTRVSAGPAVPAVSPVVTEPGPGRGVSGPWGPPPLTLLFGWAGASHRNLAKYSSIYQGQGCTTAQLTLPTRHVFKDTEEIPEVMAGVVDQLECVGVRERPLIIHCLSDTGAMCYQGLDLATRGSRLDIRGVVWDSCPGPYPEITLPRVAAFLAINWFCARRDGENLEGALASSYRLLIERGWPNYLRKLQGKPVDLSLMEGMWAGYFGRDHYLQHPDIAELFLYSNSDFYLNHKYLETEVLHRRRKEGANFSATRFRGSAHVQHYRKNKAGYEAAIASFLRSTWGLEEEEQEEERVLVRGRRGSLPHIGSFGL